MSISTNPAPARTDVLPGTPAAGPADTSTRQIRRTGLLVAAGALIWSASMATIGPNPTDSLGITISDMAALPFQGALFALVTSQLRTAATGTSRFARGMLRTEYVLLALATLWTVLHGAVPAFRDDLWLAVLDVFWPLSMLGMFVIGVKIAVAGRWRGAARFWPLVAESWAVVTVPTFIVLGSPVADLVGAGHLLIGYATLGVILTRRPDLTRAAS